MRSLSFFVLLGALGLSSVACASSNTDSPATDESGLTSSGAVEALSPPTGGRFLGVTANGTGCPAGTWHVNIGPDGRDFALYIDQYHAEVRAGDGAGEVVRDCTLSIDVAEASGFSFGVTGLDFWGYTWLPGSEVTATRMTKYYFQGDPTGGIEERREVRGPYNGGVDPSPDTVVWSPCGESRRLNVLTRIVLSKPRRSGAGYMSLYHVGGRVHGNLLWRKC